MAKKKNKGIPTVSDVLGAVHRIAPARYAESWDNVGLQIGDPAAPATKIMVALEVTTRVLDEADALKADMLVVHHPLIFRPMANLAEISTGAKLCSRMIRAGQALIAAHTNMDSVAWGTNGELADRLGMQAANRKFLKPITPESDHVKLVVYTPSDYTDRVFDAITEAGAGKHGYYSHASFRCDGIGTFRPLEGANPERGTHGITEHVEEQRLEFMVAKKNLHRVLATMIDAHPYEVPAYDVFERVGTEAPVAGLGLIGDFIKPLTLEALARRAKKELGIKSVGMIGDPKKTLSSIAICTGAGGEFVRKWREGTADVYITGEMTHHDCAEAEERGIPVLLVGHWASEAIVAQRFADMISQELVDIGKRNAEILVSKKESDPLRRV